MNYVSPYMEVYMAKSIRLKTETQRLVEDAVTDFYVGTGVTLSDAAMVDVLVNEALAARKRQVRSREAKR